MFYGCILQISSLFLFIFGYCFIIRIYYSLSIRKVKGTLINSSLGWLLIKLLLNICVHFAPELSTWTSFPNSLYFFFFNYFFSTHFSLKCPPTSPKHLFPVCSSLLRLNHIESPNFIFCHPHRIILDGTGNFIFLIALLATVGASLAILSLPDHRQVIIKTYWLQLEFFRIHTLSAVTSPSYHCLLPA